MSVKDKREKMTATREEFAEVQQAFAAYADEFAADVDDKRDVSELVDGIDTLRTEMNSTNDAFRAYSEEFAADVEHFHTSVADRRDAFDAYADIFATDVAEMQDVSDLLAAIDDLRAEMDETHEAFDAYADAFVTDVATLRDVSDLLTAISELQSEFVSVQGEFNGYASEFGADIDQFHAVVAEKRDGHKDVADAFLQYREEFHGVEVQSLLDNIAAFQREMGDYRKAFETTEEAFASFARDFYGQGAAPMATPLNNAAETAVTGTETEVDIPPIEDSVEPDGEDEDSKADDVEAEAEVETVEMEFGAEMDTEADEDVQSESVREDDQFLDDETPEDMVQCLVCGEYYQAITEPHLQTHDMTIKKYREEYGEDVPLRPDDKA
ncbi:gas vesicle protein GvpC [Haloferax mediterranei ATCC 33500]|uniref:Gas vesicle protein C n=2 Tax=Haloferax mediterranei (strain ATCC 33500 / DSM 1411 / JCM 8866 / NBRC 14739 / NCIMB 2177 / R-4) TaxID=523841 RepID=GVPC_HALMT|nr:MucR family transcriptional regulator [Haloferax mediterranei]Q02228.1 RecName: Full=Gas vesicle protein C; Short=GvpC [Haloferax mediterranei ATCC 33500]AFK19401.1 gas-vesicle operon protein gvpC [Haloferax mediterranei ATCC 33500]AHZ21249.1 gas vesicle protein GvpC [Haloferax mediterranei ATCC 33500]EMA04410.1 gas-vesicle operon protein gvpC [Haloferax mediterranei ATCC 33500]MDX5989504.1 MucR family transcriptional regulator [Haloferax mediterranei ATCC 33500]QCQ75863.1 gas vesicle prot